MAVLTTCIHAFVTMEGALMIMICVMAIMTVEITVTKMDVSDDRWEETHCIFASLSYWSGIWSVISVLKSRSVCVSKLCVFSIDKNYIIFCSQ